MEAPSTTSTSCQLSPISELVSIFHPLIFIETLPYSVRVLLEAAVRNCDDFSVKEADVEKILDWKNTSEKDVEIPFRPARVILQDFT